MKDNIINMLMNRPSWLKHEGYWRILVAVRFLLFVSVMLWAGACIVFGVMAGKLVEGIGYCVMGVALAFAIIFMFNLVLRAVGWVVSGFK